MELTLDQALQKGVEAHRAGKVQEADRYYTAILKVNPKHPDANHNMGVLAVSVGKVEAAPRFFKTAVETNPNVAQYWLSYIDALIKLDRIADAGKVLNQATCKHLKGDEFDLLERRIKTSFVQVKNETQKDSLTQPNILDELKLDQALKLAKKSTMDGLNEEAKRIYQDILKKFPKNKKALDGIKALSHSIRTKSLDQLDPPKNQLQVLANLYKGRQFEKAFNAASQLLIEFPNSVTLYNIAGASNQSLGKLSDAIADYKKALVIKPDYSDAYYNMGNALKEQGKLEEAIEAFNKALSIKPSNAEAYNNMGNVLKEQGKLEEAIEAYYKALSLKPDYAEAYYNSGNALQEQGKLAEAIKLYNKVLSLETDYAEAYLNMGNALKKQGKLGEAINAFNKALSIKPDYAMAANNMGNALQKQRKLEEAIEAFNKALSLKPNYVEAYNNMGNALKEQGKLEEAIEAFNKAISLKPDYAEVWNNLHFPLQALKTKISSDKSLEFFYPKVNNSNHGKIDLSILDYRLHLGYENEERYLNKALSFLASADNIIIKNQRFGNFPKEKMQPLPDKMVTLVHFGRSGTGLLHSLIDGHPEISTLPSIYFSEYFDHSTWARLISAGWDGMIDHFIAIYEVLFDASSSVPVPSKSKKLIHNIGIKDGMSNVGDQKNEVLTVDKRLFRKELKRLMACYKELDAFVFFKLVNIAYDRALGDHNIKSLIFYHIHNPDTYAQLNFVRLNPNTNWLLMVREPIQSCESWIRGAFREKDYFGVTNRIITMLFELDNSVYSRQNSIGVRLEDIKRQPEKTIQALCKWMGITESERMYEMTAQGKKWWGDPSSTDYPKDGMEPFGKTSINRKIGSIFSGNDQFILRTLFYPFSVRFGYTEENEEQFKVNLQKIRPMIDEMFDFEKDIAEKMQISFKMLIDSGSYQYFRSGLIERWNTLNKYQSYINMINPLKIETASID